MTNERTPAQELATELVPVVDAALDEWHFTDKYEEPLAESISDAVAEYLVGDLV